MKHMSCYVLQLDTPTLLDMSPALKLAHSPWLLEKRSICGYVSHRVKGSRLGRVINPYPRLLRWCVGLGSPSSHAHFLVVAQSSLLPSRPVHKHVDERTLAVSLQVHLHQTMRRWLAQFM